MRNGDVSGGSGQLQKAAQRLEAAWERTREHWRDENSRLFAEEELLPLMQAVKFAVESTQVYGSVVHQAKMACDSDCREFLSE